MIPALLGKETSESALLGKETSGQIFRGSELMLPIVYYNIWPFKHLQEMQWNEKWSKFMYMKQKYKI